MDKTIEQIAKITAYGVNYLFHPILMPFYLFAILVYSSLMMNNPPDIKLSILKTVALITLATPVLSVIISKTVVRLMGERTSDHYDNLLTSIVLIISYVAAIYILKDFITLHLTLRLLIAPVFILIFSNLFRYAHIEISIWVAGISSLTTFLYLFSYFGVSGLEGILFATIFLSGIVGSSRMKISDDTLSGVSVGCLLGITASVFSFFIGGIF